MKIIPIIFALFLSAQFTQANAAKKPKAAEPKPDIECQSASAEEGTSFGKVKIFFEPGTTEVARVVAHRYAMENEQAYEFDFTKKNAKFARGTSDVRYKQADGTYEPNATGISFAETIQASNAAGDGVEILFNDHRYSGHPGSSIYFYHNRKILAGSGDGVTDCGDFEGHGNEDATPYLQKLFSTGR